MYSSSEHPDDVSQAYPPHPAEARRRAVAQRVFAGQRRLADPAHPLHGGDRMKLMKKSL